jgi:hypothetical protein
MLALLCLAAASIPVSAASLSEAFLEGTQFGRSGNAAARNRINAGTASSTVPGYTPTAPASSYFGGPGLGTGAAATLAECATPQASANPACQAVDFSQTNPARRPIFTIAPNNPMLTRSKTIAADPESVAGSIVGTYSACTAQTATSPDIFETRVCNEYRTLERQSCDKTLSVSVVDNGLSCNYGDWLTSAPRIAFIRPIVFVGAICAEDIRFQWIWGYSECNGTDALQYMVNVMPSEAWQVASVSMVCGGAYNVWGSCPGGNCSYAVGWTYESFVCDQYDYENFSCDDSGCSNSCLQGHDETVYAAIASFQWQRPAHTYTITDSWDNQCAALEARLP